MQGAEQRFARDMSVAHWIMQNLPRDALCLDIGSHYGEWLGHFQKYCPQGRFIAFEPLPHLAEHLRQGFSGCEIHQLALSAVAAETEFVHIVNDPGWSGLKLQERYFCEPEISRIPVKMEMLDNICQDLPRVDFIKIDVEGAELDAFRGGAKTLRRFRPAIYFEHAQIHFGPYHYTSVDMYDFLSSLGYRILSLRSLSVMTRGDFVEAVRTADKINYNYHAECNFLAATNESLLAFGFVLGTDKVPNRSWLSFVRK